MTPLLVKGIKTDCHRPCSCKQCLILPCGSAAEYEKVLCQDEISSLVRAVVLRNKDRNGFAKHHALSFYD